MEAAAPAPVTAPAPPTPAAPVVPYSAEERAQRTRSFQRFDVNGDGALTREEMTNAAHTQMSQMLTRWDQDGDGGLSRAELQTDRVPQADIDQIFREDANGDGVLSMAELDAGQAAAFTRHDRDADGRQTLEEHLTRSPRP